MDDELTRKCPLCGRVLPPNGNCLYCGNLETKGTTMRRRQSALGAWARKGLRVLIPLLIVGAIAFVAFTDTGRYLLNRFIAALPVGKARLSENAQIVVDAAPGIAELDDERPGSLRFEEEEIEKGMVRVTVYYQEGADLLTGIFLVDPVDGSVEALDAQAEAWMFP